MVCHISITSDMRTIGQYIGMVEFLDKSAYHNNGKAVGHLSVKTAMLCWFVNGDNMVVEVEGVHLQEDELRAMKSELHEAMTLLQAMQDTDHEAGHDAGYDQEGQ